MKHYVGETVYISSRYDEKYRKYHNCIGEIASIDCGNAAVKLYNEDKQGFLFTVIVPEENIRLYMECIEQRVDYNMLIILTYTGLVEAAVNKIKHNVKNKKNSIIKFSDDVNE